MAKFMRACETDGDTMWTPMADSLYQVLAMACCKHSLNQTRCARECVIDVILRLMRRHKDHNMVQNSACAASCFVAMRHDENITVLFHQKDAKILLCAKDLLVDDSFVAKVVDTLFEWDAAVKSLVCLYVCIVNLCEHFHVSMRCFV